MLLLSECYFIVHECFPACSSGAHNKNLLSFHWEMPISAKNATTKVCRVQIKGPMISFTKVTQSSSSKNTFTLLHKQNMEDHYQDPLDQLTTKVNRFLTSWLIELSTGEIKVIKEGRKTPQMDLKSLRGLRDYLT